MDDTRERLDRIIKENARVRSALNAIVIILEVQGTDPREWNEQGHRAFKESIEEAATANAVVAAMLVGDDD